MDEAPAGIGSREGADARGPVGLSAVAPLPHTDGPPPGVSRRALSVEIWLVLALSLGADAVYAVLQLMQSLNAGVPLNHQAAVIKSSVVSNSVLNLAYQVVGIAAALVPVALVIYLLMRSGESTSRIGLDGVGLSREVLWGAALAAGVGGAGLGFYIIAFHLGANLDVVPTNLPDVWWRIPVLVLTAIEDGVLEEVVVCGYLLHRLAQLRWNENRSLVTSAVIRGSYHLYQGFGGFVANGVMGLLFGRLFQRKGRLVRLVIAHSLIDTVAFVGYVLLVGHVSWLP